MVPGDVKSNFLSIGGELQGASGIINKLTKPQ